MGKSVIDFNEKKGFICDMDGVIYHGNQILPGVPEFIQWLHDEKKEYLFLTNNSGYTPRELNQKLARMGLDVPEEHFYTSALATAAFLKEQAAGCSAFVIGEAGLLNALYDVGITMNDVNPDYVVVGEGRSYSLDTLTKATNLVLKGAKLIGANSDVSGPIENGIAPACRALIAPIEMATGTQAYFCGKPNPLMMRTGLNMLGCHSAEAVMVGDRICLLYRCDFRNGKWYVYCIGSLWMFNEGHTQNLCLSSDNGIEWSGRYRQYSKSKREIVFDNWKTSCISTSFPYHGNRTGNFTVFL